MATDRPILDRRIPTDFAHVDTYPASGLRQLQRTVKNVERVLTIPSPKDYQAFYDQGNEGACVGFGESILMSILNRRRYDALWLYHEAQLVDEWKDTPPQSGTTLRAGFDVLRDKGHRRIFAGTTHAPALEEGIVAVNRWLTTTDQVRTAIADAMPVCLGINWYDKFYDPIALPTATGRQKRDAWIGVGKEWGKLAGGHCICCVGASDKRQAVALFNSWGAEFPWPTWLPYDTLTTLLNESGEAGIVTDK